MAPPPDARYTPTPAEVYEARLGGVTNGLRRLADDVARRGRPSTDLATLRPAHVVAAVHVQHTVLTRVSQLGLDELVGAAVRADHPDADKMPGVLLDKATAAIEAALPGLLNAGIATEVAEAVLRTVGLLR